MQVIAHSSKQDAEPIHLQALRRFSDPKVSEQSLAVSAGVSRNPSV